MNLSNINKEHKAIVEALRVYGEENIVVLDDNIVLFALSQYNDNWKTRSHNKSTIRLSGFRRLENDRFLVYTKDGQLFNEEVDMAAILTDEDGNTVGYVFRLAEIYEKPKRLGETLGETKDQAIVVYTYINDKITTIDDMYFIGNDIDSEELENSLCEIHKDLSILSFGSDSILTFKNKKYRYSNSVMTLNSKDRKFSNIGKFIPR